MAVDEGDLPHTTRPDAHTMMPVEQLRLPTEGDVYGRIYVSLHLDAICVGVTPDWHLHVDDRVYTCSSRSDCLWSSDNMIAFGCVPGLIDALIPLMGPGDVARLALIRPEMSTAVPREEE